MISANIMITFLFLGLCIIHVSANDVMIKGLCMISANTVINMPVCLCPSIYQQGTVFKNSTPASFVLQQLIFVLLAFIQDNQCEYM